MASTLLPNRLPSQGLELRYDANKTTIFIENFAVAVSWAEKFASEAYEDVAMHVGKSHRCQGIKKLMIPAEVLLDGYREIIEESVELMFGPLFSTMFPDLEEIIALVDGKTNNYPGPEAFDGEYEVYGVDHVMSAKIAKTLSNHKYGPKRSESISALSVREALEAERDAAYERMSEDELFVAETTGKSSHLPYHLETS